MKISQFVSICEQCMPDGWTLWAGGSAAQYNMEKDVSDVFAMIIPRWPATWREGCVNTVRVEFRLFKYTDIEPLGNIQQHNPYNGIELIEALHAAANDFLTDLNETTSVQVTSVTDYDFLDMPGGPTVNAQAQLQFVATLNVWKVAEQFDYFFDFDLT